MIVLFFVHTTSSSIRIDTTNFTNGTSSEEFMIRRISNFIDAATSYLIRVCHTVDQDPTSIGKFTYTAYLDEELQTNFIDNQQEDYNLLRHNGAIYSLLLSYNRSPSTETLDAIERAVVWLKTVAIGPVPDMSNNNTIVELDNRIIPKSEKILPNMLAAWESYVMKGGSSSKLKPTAKLGGAGLALVALVGLEHIVPDSTSIEYMRQIGNFIVYMQKDDGSFVCRFKPHKGGKDDSWISLFYPGEAALGLLYLAEIEEEDSTHHRQRWIDVATKALLYLESIRRNIDLEEVEPDHWALLSTSKLLPLLDSKSSTYYRIYSHAIKVITSMISTSTSETLIQKYKGCHTGDGETCTTATQIEGMMAALTFVKDTELYIEEEDVQSLRQRMILWIQHGTNFLMNSQFLEEKNNMFGGIPRHYPILNHDDGEVRIDYVQHSMSGMIAFEQYLLQEGPYNEKLKNKVHRKKKLRQMTTAMKGHIQNVANKGKTSIEETPLRWFTFLLSMILMTFFVGSFIVTNAPQTKKDK